jgi:hypothetical protein
MRTTKRRMRNKTGDTEETKRTKKNLLRQYQLKYYCERDRSHRHLKEASKASKKKEKRNIKKRRKRRREQAKEKEQNKHTDRPLKSKLRLLFVQVPPENLKHEKKRNVKEWSSRRKEKQPFEEREKQREKRQEELSLPDITGNVGCSWV